MRRDVHRAGHVESIACRGEASLPAIELRGGVGLVLEGPREERSTRERELGACVESGGHGTGEFHAAVEGQPAWGAELGSVAQLHIGPDHALYLAEMHSAANRVRRFAPPSMAGVSVGESLLPAEDGREAYVFDGRGMHLRTVDTRTGATTAQMTYDAAGLLIGIADVDGDVTTIERDAAGVPLSITGPFGQVTRLQVNAEGYLSAVTNPAEETVSLGYGDEGLLTRFTDALNRAHAFTYDAAGVLVHDADPAGGSKTLARASEPGGHGVTITTALGRAATYHVAARTTGVPARAIDLPNGLRASAVGGAGSPVAMTLPDGRAITWAPGADPRFGMLSPFAKTELLTTPGGRAMSIARSRAADLADPGDAMSFSSLTETTTVNGRSFVEIFSKAQRTVTRTTPAGRRITTRLDDRGRVVQIEVPGILPVQLTYDAHGRLETTAQGGRTSARAYPLLALLVRLHEHARRIRRDHVRVLPRGTRSANRVLMCPCARRPTP
jgi:YD repeat-containing protein